MIRAGVTSGERSTSFGRGASATRLSGRALPVSRSFVSLAPSQLEVAGRGQGREGRSHREISFLVPAGLVQEVDGAERPLVPDDGHVEHGLAAEREDQLVVEEDGADVVGRPAHVRPPLAEKPLRPCRGCHRLTPAHRIGRGLVAVVTLRLRGVGMIDEHGEELVTDDGAHGGIESREERMGLARLPAMTGRIQRQLIETQRLLDSEPPLAVLANLADAWRGIATDIAAWSDLLTREAIVVEGELDRLDRLADQWARTREEARRSQAPSTVLQRIDITTTAIGLSRNTALSRRASILSLQARVAQQLALVQDAQARVARARGLDLAMLFRRDSPPVWRDADRGPVPWREVPTKLWAGLVSEGRLLAQFMADRPERAIIHALLFVALLIFLRMGHRHARHWSEDDPDLARVARIFRFPISAALVLALTATFWLYPRPPLVLRNVVALLMLVPVIRILRQLTAPTPPIGFFALGAFFLVNRVRELALDVPGLEQRIFVVEMLVAVAVIMIERGLVRRNEAAASSVASSSRVVVPPPLLWIALAALLLALGLGAGGYMPIARLIGDGVLRSGYAAMLLYAAVRVADGLLAWALRSWPHIGLQMVRRHRALLERRVLRLLRWVAMFLWIALTPDALSLLASVREILSVGLAASVTRGTITISLGDVLDFVVPVALAFFASRFVRFALGELI